MSESTPLVDMTVATLLTRWPQTIGLFRRYKMMPCVGCLVAPFCPLSKALSTFAIPPEPFLAELKRLIEANSP